VCLLRKGKEHRKKEEKTPNAAKRGRGTPRYVRSPLQILLESSFRFHDEKSGEKRQIAEFTKTRRKMTTTAPVGMQVPKKTQLPEHRVP